VIKLEGYNVKSKLKDEMYTWGSALKELVKENKYEIGLYVLELGTIWSLG